MIAEELARQIKQCLDFIPTADQDHAIYTFCNFMFCRDSRVAMIMRGSAGTGKTSLAAAIVKTLHSLHHNVVLLAPTGRAAKVLSVNAGAAAYTIHRRIYRQKTFNGEDTGFNLNFNKQQDTLFMVDEASMIANYGQGDGTTFGSGRLLDDMIEYVYSGRNCRLLFIGDKAQLPPVGEEESPALLSETLSSYGLHIFQCDLNEVLRQASHSGILYNATMIRQMITHDEMTRLPLIRLFGFADIQVVTGDNLIEQLTTSYTQVGIDETMVITRSNKRANIYNRGIRNMVLGREEELTTGDMLMIVKNNYYWTERIKAEEAHTKASNESNAANSSMQESILTTYSDGTPREHPLIIRRRTPLKAPAQDSAVKSEMPLSFIANGDRAKIIKVRNARQLYGFHFVDLWLQFPDYDNYEMTCTAITDSLTSEAPALTREQGEQLFNAILADYADLPLKSDRMKHVETDTYYNALQIKYAYAITCHKAQGGQWAHVYIDQGYMTDDMLTPDYIHWLYTAFTRASEKLFLVNWPKVQTEVQATGK